MIVPCGAMARRDDGATVQCESPTVRGQVRGTLAPRTGASHFGPDLAPSHRRPVAPLSSGAPLLFLLEDRPEQRLAGTRRVEPEQRQADEYRERPVRRNRPPV